VTQVILLNREVKFHVLTTYWLQGALPAFQASSRLAPAAPDALLFAALILDR
jgi:hypothetical protein